MLSGRYSPQKAEEKDEAPNPLREEFERRLKKVVSTGFKRKKRPKDYGQKIKKKVKKSR